MSRPDTYEEHMRHHVANSVLVVGCKYCEPEIKQTKKSSEQHIIIGADNHELTG